MRRPLTLGIAALALLLVVPPAPAVAAFPGRSARIAFERFDPVTNLGDIHTMTETGSGDLNVTGTPATEDRNPAWSADGTRIALRRATAGPDQLWVMNGDGSGLTVVPGSGTAAQPAWSPDGTRLVYTCYDPLTLDTHICARDVTGGGFQALTATPGIDDRGPVWSPDGKRIAFSRALAAGGSQLVVLNLATLTLTAVTPAAAGTYDDWPDWSPDGKQLAFARFVVGSGAGAAIYRVPAAGGTAKLVVPGPPAKADAHHTMPAWSPDGKRIAYVELDDDETWGHVFTVNPDGSGRTQLTFGAVTDETPDWGAA